MKYIVLSVLLVGLLFGALTIYLMERFVLSRVSRISSEVSAIEAEGDHSGRIHVTGQDELTKMASAVNNMLTALEETQSALRKSHDSLEVKVQERTTDLTHKIAVLKTLSEVGNEIMMATEAGRLTNLVCRHARELFHAPKVLIAVTDSSGGNHISASCGLSDITATEDDMKLLLKQGFFNNDEVVGQGSINLDSFGSNSEVGRELRKREAIKATAVAPLIAEGKTLGAIFLFDTVSRTFTEEEIQTLELLAGQVALALDTTHLLKEENTRREELASLYDLARKLADTAPDVNTILSLAAEHAANNVQVTFARFVMIEEDKLVGHAVYPRRIISDDRTIGHGIPLAFLPYCQRVLKQKDPVVLRDDAADLSNSEHEMLFLKTAKSVCLVPLFAGEGPLGILVLGEARETDREPLTPEKLHLASSIGDQTASTLRRAELFSELERAYLQTVLALANAVDAKDTYTADHGSRLAQLASAVGNRLDLTPREIDMAPCFMTSARSASPTLSC
jgi:GAF domain-containing protein/HAMP domain-containing protein